MNMDHGDWGIAMGLCEDHRHSAQQWDGVKSMETGISIPHGVAVWKRAQLMGR